MATYIEVADLKGKIADLAKKAWSLTKPKRERLLKKRKDIIEDLEYLRTGGHGHDTKKFEDQTPEVQDRIRKKREKDKAAIKKLEDEKKKVNEQLEALSKSKK